MKQGQILEVILDDGEPIRNVPRPVREEGNQILNVDKIGSEWRLELSSTSFRNWSVGLPWRELPGICCFRRNISEAKSVQLRPCMPGLGQGMME